MSSAAALAAVVAALLAGAGAWLIWTAVAPGGHPGEGSRSGARPPAAARTRPTASNGRRQASPYGGLQGWLARKGLSGVSPAGIITASAAAAAGGGLGAFLLFDGAAPAAVAAAFAATFPPAAYRRRALVSKSEALEAWPGLLEEIRLRTGSLGRSVPQALFEAGRRAPSGWVPIFSAAERHWMLTTDFAQTLDILKEGLADPTADVVCETLLMAYDLGGTDLDAQLRDLTEDRTVDVQSRKDAASRLAGVRFARRFVLLVPLGMAAAGLTIGAGRQAYATAGGQIAVVIGLVSVAACWWWSGRLMRLPTAPRVFR